MRKNYRTKNGQCYVVRPVTKKDLPALVDILNSVRAERKFVRSEKIATLEQYIKSFEEFTIYDSYIWLVAEMNGKVVGESKIWRGDGKEYHVGYLFLMIASEWRNLGIGEVLLRDVLTQAKNYEKICAIPFSTNFVAIRLLQKYGFIEEARRKKQYKLDNGSYVDEVFMTKWLF